MVHALAKPCSGALGDAAKGEVAPLQQHDTQYPPDRRPSGWMHLVAAPTAANGWPCVCMYH